MGQLIFQTLLFFLGYHYDPLTLLKHLPGCWGFLFQKHKLQRWWDSVFLLSDPILFLKNDRAVSYPNPVLLEIVLSVFENYLKVHYDEQQTLLCCVILPLA